MKGRDITNRMRKHIVHCKSCPDTFEVWTRFATTRREYCDRCKCKRKVEQIKLRASDSR